MSTPSPTTAGGVLRYICPVAQTLALHTNQIIAAVDDGVGWIVLNNQDKHNAISSAMFAGIDEAVAHFDADPTVRTMVIRGAGDAAFAAGADLNDLPADGFPPGLARLCASNKPSIAMIQGWCLGGGVMTALCADIRMASDTAVFSIPAARLGVGYPLEGTLRLVETIGSSAASDLLLTGERQDAAWAKSVGLAQRVVPHAELHRRVVDLAGVLKGNAPLAAVASKTSIRAAVGTGSDHAAMDAIAVAWASQDMVEGRKAFAERRAPNFGGI